MIENSSSKTTARFKLRSIFLFVNLTVLFLPLFGIIFFRFYENQLIKQTESELISQAAVFSAIYKQYMREALDGTPYGTELKLSIALAETDEASEYYTPIAPQADLATTEILPPRPDGFVPEPESEPPTMLADATPSSAFEQGSLAIVTNEPEPSPDKSKETVQVGAASGIVQSPASNLDTLLETVRQGRTNTPQSSNDQAVITGESRAPAQKPTSRMASAEDTIIVAGSRVRGRTAMDSNIPVDVIEIKVEVLSDHHAELAGAKMLPVIVETQKTTLSGIKILDYNGVAVAGRNEVGLNFSLLPEIETAMKGDYVSLLRERISDEPLPPLSGLSRGTGVRLFVAFPIIENDKLWGVVYLSRTPQNILKHIYANKEKMALIAISLLGLTLLLALLTSYTVSKPLNRLIGRVKRFTEGELAAIEPMTSPGVKEIELLSESFSNMALSLNNRSHYIREFALSVSHEFKTPITSIQGSAELILEHLDDMDREKKRKFLANIIVDSDRLKRLINRLLELAKADNFTPTSETTSLLDTLSSLKDRYKDFDLNLSFEDVEDCQVLIAREHFETILTNLFDNALQNEANEVEISGKLHYGFITLCISDDGNGISDANKAKIFDSFFTTKRENGGTGLGLGIVTSLLTAHNGSIELGDAEQGAMFVVTLPVRIK